MSGYNKRSRVEAAIGRYKQVVGDGLRSRKDQRRTTEVGVSVHVLNRMLELGRPDSVRGRMNTDGVGGFATHPSIHATTPDAPQSQRGRLNTSVAGLVGARMHNCATRSCLSRQCPGDGGQRWPASSRQRFGPAKWILCRLGLFCAVPGLHAGRALARPEREAPATAAKIYAAAACGR
jgi:hypothetical protein